MRAIRAFGLPLLVALAAAPGLAQAATGEAGDDLAGRTIESVAYTTDGPVNQREVQRLIALEVGQPLSDGATAETIRNLFGTSQFSNVLVQAEPTASGGVAVTVHLWRAFTVRTIKFEGKTSFTREELRRAIPFAEGDPFAAGPLAAGATSIQRRLLTDGYLQPEVDPEVEYDRATFTVTVVYDIQAGARGLVTEPFFDGETTPFTAQALASEGKIRLGKPYRESKLRSGAERIRKYLLEAGYFKASVELIAAEPTEGGQIRPVYRIAVGPLFQIQAAGVKLKTARKELLALLAGQSFDEELLELWADNRKLELQKAGHYHATVTASTSQGSSATIVALSVEPGPKYALEKITITGNGSVDEDTLRDLMVTRPKGLPLVQKGRLIDSNLEGDVSAILGYYQTRGWIDAKVEARQITDGSKPGLLDLDHRDRRGAAHVRLRSTRRRRRAPERRGDRQAGRGARWASPSTRRFVRQDVGALTSALLEHRLARGRGPGR